jgi:hypothetical protein
MCGQETDSSVQTKTGWVCQPCVRVCVEITLGQLGTKRTQALKDIRMVDRVAA